MQMNTNVTIIVSFAAHKKSKSLPIIMNALYTIIMEFKLTYVKILFRKITTMMGRQKTHLHSKIPINCFAFSFQLRFSGLNDLFILLKDSDQ